MTPPAPELDWSRLLADRVALITGAGSGQGRAAAELFARHGARVVVADIDDTAAAQTVALLDGSDERHVAVHADVSRRADCEAMVDATIAACGRIDVLYNNAARYIPCALLDCSDDDWDATIDTNLSAIFWTCRAAVPHMVAGGRGSIVNTASVGADAAAPGYVAYGPSKAGVVALTRQIAIDYGPAVRANVVAPGGIETPMYRLAHGTEDDYDAYVERATARIPLRRLGRPEDVAHVALLLASDATAYVSGAVAPVDGGLVARL
ncbi:MAG TPA: SDR family NAD(P)-dependent oxidoreductase [Acidimicrobiia bacterium]